MKKLPTDKEIDEMIRLDGIGGGNKRQVFAEMCMREGAKLLRDRLKNSEEGEQ